MRCGSLLESERSTHSCAGFSSAGPTPSPYDTRFGNVPDDQRAFATAVSAMDDFVGDIMAELRSQNSACGPGGGGGGRGSGWRQHEGGSVGVCVREKNTKERNEKRRAYHSLSKRHLPLGGPVRLSHLQVF